MSTDAFLKAIQANPSRTGAYVSLVIVVLALAVGAVVWHFNFIHPRTNDAMVRANTVDVIIQHVSGRIVELAVADNQPVHRGDLLYAIDARPYEAAAAQAEAELRVAERELSGQIAELRGAEAKVREAARNIEALSADVVRQEAQARYQNAYLQRILPLESQKFVTRNQVQEAEAKRNAADASVRDAQARVAAGRELLTAAQQAESTAQAHLAQYGHAYGRIQAAEARLRAAQLDVEYCTVRAPFDGLVTNLNTSPGQYVSAGQKLFALVDDTTWYVIANYKETYLRHISPGMAVDVFLASYPGKHFRGEVQGIGWANYPDNVKVTDGLPDVQRTLNWVMLAARFPVRIKLLERDPDHPFRMGMTAFTTVGITHEPHHD